MESERGIFFLLRFLFPLSLWSSDWKRLYGGWRIDPLCCSRALLVLDMNDNISAGISKDETLPLTTASSSDSSPRRPPQNYFISNGSVIVYAGTFFTCMVIMELTLEGTQKAFGDMPALAFAVTLFQFGCCFLLPVILSRGATLREIPQTPMAMVPYLVLSLCVFGSSGLVTMSIRYVSYPTKVILKSTKLIPTMVVATLLQNGQRYGRLEYLAATLLCAGAAGYGFGESLGKKSNQEDESYWGILLLCTSVFCDAFTPNIQQRLMAPVASTNINNDHDRATSSSISWQHRLHRLQQSILPPGGAGLGVSASTLMTNANFVGGIGILLYMTVTGALVEAMGVAFVEPRLFLLLTVIGVSLAMAVFSYTRLIQASGSVVAVGVATLRKVVTVILSYVFYPKPFSTVHAVSSLLVLGGVLLSSYAKQRPTPATHRTT
jgi:solute carrier family 35 (adenosine 3'-phospho 5'-phosphosulfate transporter), member B3